MRRPPALAPSSPPPADHRASPGGRGLWTASVPAVASSKWYFEQLWVNGRRAMRAHSPNQFYFYTRGKVGYGVDLMTGRTADLSRRAFRARPSDIAPLLALTPAQLHDVTVVIYHSWEAGRLRVAVVCRQTDTVYTTGPAGWPFENWGPSQRYQLENFRAALDRPGEWFLDRDGTLLYRPRPAEDMRTAEVVAPVGTQFVTIQGTPDHKVRYVTFRGLTFEDSGYTLPPQGEGDGQAAVGVPGSTPGTRNGERSMRRWPSAVMSTTALFTSGPSAMRRRASRQRSVSSRRLSRAEGCHDMEACSPRTDDGAFSGVAEHRRPRGTRLPSLLPPCQGGGGTEKNLDTHA